MKTRQINIMVVDDHQLIINGLSSLVEEEKDICFCGGANTWSQAKDILEKGKNRCCTGRHQHAGDVGG